MDNFANAHRYQHESLTLEEVERVIASYKAMGWWP